MNDFYRFLSEVVTKNYSYLWFVVLALWGGTANYLSRIRRGKLTFSITELIGEWVISGFAGISTAYICAELQCSWPMTAFFAGVAGHMGGRSIFIFEQWLTNKFK